VPINFYLSKDLTFNTDEMDRDKEKKRLRATHDPQPEK
jgi:hypothetical protein